jgi:dipeptidyl aminopeptidase/acylaminoacyl peptidase
MNAVVRACSTLIAIAALLSSATRADEKPAPRAKRYTIEQFMKTTRTGGAAFSPDESTIYFHSNRTGIFNVFAAPTAGGEARQITRSTKESTFLVAAFPRDGRLLFAQDRGGDENNHLFLREPDGSERDLTPGDKVRAEFHGFRRDGKAFFFATNERDPRSFDVFRMDAATLERTLVYKAEDPLLQVAGVSEDGRYLVLEKASTNVDSDVYLWDAETKQRKHLTPHEGQATHSFTGFDFPVKNVFLLTNAGREFTALARYDLAEGKLHTLDAPEWDVWYSHLSRNGKYRVTAVNEDARTSIKVSEAASGARVKLPDLGEGDVTSVVISHSETKLAFYLNGDRSPADLYVLDLPTGKVTRLTRSLAQEIDPDALVESSGVRFKSFDGLAIPNLLFKPQGASAASKVPALVWVHGGPGGQTRKGYSAAIQFLVNHGYAVLGINNRGSSGYGKTFFTADDQKHGREPLWDCVEGKKYLQSLDWVDGKRIGILGGSYGGYMTLAALAFKPDVFDVGVDIFGVSNWLRTLKSIPPYWEAGRKGLYQEIGNPETQEAMLREISPVFHADKIKKPLLVLQGANDPRVIKPESDDIVAQVKKNGVPVEYVVFPDEGHGFTKRENEVKAYGAILEFLDQHLAKAPAAEPGAN